MIEQNRLPSEHTASMADCARVLNGSAAAQQGSEQLLAQSASDRRKGPRMNGSRSDLSDLGLPIRLAEPVRFHVGRIAASGPVTPEIVSRDLDDEFSALTGGAARAASLRTRVFDLSLLPGDEVLVRTAGTGLPLIVRRAGELIVNFDLQATQAFSFTDSDRPIYTYVPGFNIHSVPEEVRRPLSNLVQSLRAPKRVDLPAAYRRLPLTEFEVPRTPDQHDSGARHASTAGRSFTGRRASAPCSWRCTTWTPAASSIGASEIHSFASKRSTASGRPGSCRPQS